MDELILIGSVLSSTLRLTAPLLLVALAGLLAERSGVVDLGLEGKMLAAAFRRRRRHRRHAIGAARPRSPRSAWPLRWRWSTALPASPIAATR